MRRFAYWRDPLCLAACALYGVNRWVVAPRAHGAFWRFYGDDFLLIPCALPILLWMHRRLGLRAQDAPPSAAEVGLYWLVWSILFEVIGPHLFRRATGDPWDVVVYVVGGIGAGLWWNRRKIFSRWTVHEL